MEKEFWDRYWEKQNDGSTKYSLSPDSLLVEYLHMCKKGIALDFGMGEGRNAFHLARHGFEVEGFDISPTAVSRCMEYSRLHGLSVKAEVADLRNVHIEKNRYNLIVLSYVMNFFTLVEVGVVMEKLRSIVKLNGHMYLSVLTIDDPGYGNLKGNFVKIEKATFRDTKRGITVHYFSDDELPDLVNGFQDIYYAKGRKLDCMHAEPHYHAFYEFLGARTGT